MCYNLYGDDMQINKIEKLKNNKYRMTIDDEKIVTFDNVILENNLLYKKTIDKELYDKIINDTNYYNIYNNTVKYILKKRRSEKEIINYLKKYIFNCDEINCIILKLKQINLIDDIAYCNAYINDNIYLSKNGINKIKSHLIDNEIPIHIIEDSLDNIDLNIMDSRLEKIILKKISTNKKYSNSYLKQKILNEMINLGYDKQKIVSILDNNIIGDKDILESEFNKLYTKLSKKYNNDELFNNIKKKLFSKGFGMEDINNLIKEKQKN